MDPFGDGALIVFAGYCAFGGVTLLVGLVGTALVRRAQTRRAAAILAEPLAPAAQPEVAAGIAAADAVQAALHVARLGLEVGPGSVAGASPLAPRPRPVREGGMGAPHGVA
jgi:hypothetical protein